MVIDFRTKSSFVSRLKEDVKLSSESLEVLLEIRCCLQFLSGEQTKKVKLDQVPIILNALGIQPTVFEVSIFLHTQ
jgi:hypothetical protein